jgi:hypothetical protein
MLKRETDKHDVVEKKKIINRMLINNNTIFPNIVVMKGKTEQATSTYTLVHHRQHLYAADKVLRISSFSATGSMLNI